MAGAIRDKKIANGIASIIVDDLKQVTSEALERIFSSGFPPRCRLCKC